MPRSTKLERDFQKDLIPELHDRFPGIFILKNDANYLQGVPDLLLLFNDRWAMLETKRSTTASYRPNQEYYIDLLNGMSFAAAINPQNKEDVLNDLQQAFGSRRTSRYAKR